MPQLDEGNGNGSSVDGRRGTALWSINVFRQDALCMFLDDLMRIQDVGLSEPECEKVQLALGRIVNSATEIPDGSVFRRAIWQDLQKLEDTYKRWNDIKGSDKPAIERRIKVYNKLRKRRHKVSQRVRNNQHILHQELDIRLIESWYDAFGKLIQQVPTVFIDLAKALSRFNKRLG